MRFSCKEGCFAWGARNCRTYYLERRPIVNRCVLSSLDPAVRGRDRILRHADSGADCRVDAAASWPRPARADSSSGSAAASIRRSSRGWRSSPRPATSSPRSCRRTAIPTDERDAAMIAKHFSLTTVRVDLSDAYDTTIAAAQAATLRRCPRMTARTEAATIRSRSRRPLANIKPRLRMTTLYFLANSLDYLVAGTGNRSELSIGYFTKHGDGGRGSAADRPPAEERSPRAGARAERAAAIIERTPSAGLWIGQSDEDEMGFTYADLERYLQEGPQGVSPALAMKIERLIRSSEHKRALPPIPEATNGDPAVNSTQCCVVSARRRTLTRRRTCSRRPRR